VSKVDILEALPKLNAQDRREILEKICDLEESQLTKSEITFLEDRLSECRRNPEGWTTWEDAKPRILARFQKP
jgi:hypothetical protein